MENVPAQVLYDHMEKFVAKQEFCPSHSVTFSIQWGGIEIEVAFLIQGFYPKLDNFKNTCTRSVDDTAIVTRDNLCRRACWVQLCYKLEGEDSKSGMKNDSEL
jgi:hypothetical protein